METTEITPVPPTDKMGRVRGSSPEIRSKSGAQSSLTRIICSRFPLASFTPTMRGWRESSARVSGAMLMTERPGML